jgi:hypothetical protein
LRDGTHLQRLRPWISTEGEEGCGSGERDSKMSRRGLWAR